MMKNYIIPLIVVVSVIVATHSFSSNFYKERIEEEEIKLANEQGKVRYSEWSFSLFTDAVGQSLDKALWKYDVDAVSVDDCVEFPCLLIYVPQMDNLCMSCVNYAISCVQEVYSAEWQTAKIGILTCGYNGELKERVLKKKVYSVEKDMFAIKNFNNPVYLLLDKDKKIISSFMPYEVMEGWTTEYLKSVRSLLK